MTWTCDECGKAWPDEKKENYLSHIYRTHRLDTESYIERYRRIREEIPEKYRDAYEEITGQGKSPKGFQAAVCYIESEATIDEAAAIFNVCEVPIRNHTNELIDRGVVTLAYVRENNHSNGHQSFGERRVYGESDGDLNAADVREIRDAAGITQEEFAERVGVTTNSVANWERDDGPGPSPQHAQQIKDHFGELATV